MLDEAQPPPPHLVESSTLVTMWYVAPGCLPIQVQVRLIGERFAFAPAMCCGLPVAQLFEDEKAAVEFALKNKRAAREAVEREYRTLLDRRDKLEEIEDEEWERENTG